jgi:hypothetical protein
VREIDLDRLALTVDYVEGFSECRATAGELALIYSVLPELVLELNAAEDVNLMQTDKE